MDTAVRQPRILIVSYSRFGALTVLAKQIADGARSVKGVEVRFFVVEDAPIEALQAGEQAGDMEMRRAEVIGELGAADAVIVGAPAYFGGMASPMKRFFEDCATASNAVVTDRSRPWRHYLFRDKIGAAFTSSATPHGGNEQALHSILTMMMHLGVIVVTPGQQMPILENDAAPYGATAITGAEGNRIPTDAEMDGARNLGQRVAEVATWLQWGRTEWEKRYGAIADQSSSVTKSPSGQPTPTG